MAYQPFPNEHFTSDPMLSMEGTPVEASHLCQQTDSCAGFERPALKGQSDNHNTLYSNIQDRTTDNSQDVFVNDYRLKLNHTVPSNPLATLTATLARCLEVCSHIIGGTCVALSRPATSAPDDVSPCQLYSSGEASATNSVDTHLYLRYLSSSSPDTNPEGSSGTSVPMGAIVGIAVGSVVLAILLVVWWKRYVFRKKSFTQPQHQHDMQASPSSHASQAPTVALDTKHMNVTIPQPRDAMLEDMKANKLFQQQQQTNNTSIYDDVEEQLKELRDVPPGVLNPEKPLEQQIAESDVLYDHLMTYYDE